MARHYKCEGPFRSRRDAEIEAKIIRQIGHKASVKRMLGGFKVCRTMKRRRR